jgi:hypothetical protein
MNSATKSRLAMLAVLLAACFSTIRTAGADQPQVTEKQMESWWSDLALDEPQASRALLRFASNPEQSVTFLETRLVPLTPERLDGLLVQLGSADEATWKAAFDELRYFDPRLAVDLEPLMDKVKTYPLRERLVDVLSDRPAGSAGSGEIKLRRVGDAKDNWYNFSSKIGSWGAEPSVARLGIYIYTPKAYWKRAIRAIVLLEHIGTPDAINILNNMAGGDPDAQPTAVAKEALAAGP